MALPLTTPILCPVMIGRDAELATVQTFLRSGRGVLLVSGEAGIGKSRLVRAARDSAAAAGLNWLEGRLFREDQTMPMALACDLVRQLQHRVPPETLLTAAGASAPELARLVPGLGDLPAMPLDDLDLARRRLCEACSNAILHCGGTPLVLVCEDLHWADANSLELLLRLARHAQREPLQLLLTYRSDETTPELADFLAQADHERLAEEMRLRPLHAIDVATVMREMFRAQSPPPANLLHAICSLTEGNPYFIEEVLSTISAESAMISEAGRWQTETTASRVPRSVRETVERRVRSLSPAAREVAQLAAVCGREFEFAFLQQLSGFSEEALLAALKELISTHLVTESANDCFAFRHALTREALLAGLLERELRQLHRRIFECLAGWPGSNPQQRLDDLGRHACGAGLWEEAAQFALQAADYAESLLAPRATAEQLTRAITAMQAQGQVPLIEWRSRRGRAHETLGNFPAALADHEAALAQAQASGHQRVTWQALNDLSLLWSARDYDQAGAYAAQALAAAEALGDPVCIARALNRLGNWRLNCDDPHTALGYHTQALEMLRDAGDERGVAETLDLLGMSSLLGGHHVAGRAWYEQGIACYRRLGDRRGLAGALTGFTLAGPTYHGISVPPAVSRDEGLATAEEALALCRDMEWRAAEAYLLWGVYGMCLGACGNFAAALDGLHAAIHLARQIEHRQWEASAHCILGLVLSDLDDNARARTELTQGLTLAQELRSPYWIRSAVGWLASVLVRLGERDEARALLVRHDAASLPKDTIAARLTWVAAAELALADDRPRETLQLVQDLATADTDAARQPVAQLELLRGKALAALGNMPDAREALETAISVAEVADLRAIAYRGAAALVALHQRQGNTAAAANALAKAVRLRAELAAAIPDATMRETFLNSPGPADTATRAAEHARNSPDTLPQLTRRETEVALLLVDGLSNRAVGEQLFLSEWTVATHVRNILAKLDLANRAQIAAWAVQHRLPD